MSTTSLAFRSEPLLVAIVTSHFMGTTVFTAAGTASLHLHRDG